MFLHLSRCPICKVKPSSQLGCCSSCAEKLFKPVLGVDMVVLGPYQARLERAIGAFKYHHATRLAKLFVAELVAVLRKADWQLDVVCPVPLHWTRYLTRGYNQAALLAKPLARELGLDYRPLLTRKRRTRQQAKLSRDKRVQNVATAFAAMPAEGKRILLIDDVLTSGATSDACITTLLKAGAACVKVAVLASANPRSLR